MPITSTSAFKVLVNLGGQNMGRRGAAAATKPFGTESCIDPIFFRFPFLTLKLPLELKITHNYKPNRQMENRFSSVTDFLGKLNSPPQI